MIRTLIFSRLSSAAGVAVLLSCLAYGQGAAPRWLDAGWRDVGYPVAEWYTGFAQSSIKGGADVSKAIKRLERDAQNKLVESIVVRITGASTVERQNVRETQGGAAQSRSSADYRQVIEATSSAEVAQMEVRSYHDALTGTAYSFAAVKRTDLAGYYASQVEAALSEAQRHLDMATQFAGLGKKKEAFEELDAGQRRVESTASHRDLLTVVDPANGIRLSQGGRVNDMLKAIAAARADTRSAMAVYVTGAEDMHGQKVDIIASGLQTLLSKNDHGIVDNEKEAGYIIRIEASVCHSRTGNNFHYANVCVKITLSNAVTNKIESAISVTGPKTGGRDERNAAEKAYKAAVPQVWDAVKDRIAVN